MNLFVDCGAHKGLVTKHWLEHHDDYYAVLFEPNSDIPIESIGNMQVIRQAVWVKDGNMNLYFDRNGKLESSSLFADKKGMSGLSAPVPTVDFARWIDSQYSKYKHIVVKMDIEGAEYDVLEHLIKTTAITCINEMYIEWHWKTVRMGMKREGREKRHKALLKKLRAVNSLKLHGEYFREYSLKDMI